MARMAVVKFFLNASIFDKIAATKIKMNPICGLTFHAIFLAKEEGEIGRFLERREPSRVPLVPLLLTKFRDFP